MKLNLIQPLKRILKTLSKKETDDINAVAIIDKIADSLEEANVNITNQLPEPLTIDDDKILGVVNGKWEKVDPITYDDKEIVAAKQIVTLTDQIAKAIITLEENINVESMSDLSDATVIVNGRTFKYDTNYNIFYYDYLEKHIIYAIEPYIYDDTFAGITFTAYDNNNQIVTGDYIVEIVRPKSNAIENYVVDINLHGTTSTEDNMMGVTFDQSFNEIAEAFAAGKRIYARIFKAYYNPSFIYIGSELEVLSVRWFQQMFDSTQGNNTRVIWYEISIRLDPVTHEEIVESYKYSVAATPTIENS